MRGCNGARQSARLKIFALVNVPDIAEINGAPTLNLAHALINGAEADCRSRFGLHSKKTCCGMCTHLDSSLNIFASTLSDLMLIKHIRFGPDQGA
jgi:hypothetical protein